MDFEKKVDESWKEQVDKERRMQGVPQPGPVQQEPVHAQPQQPQQSPQPQRRPAGGRREGPADGFQMFLSSLSMQAMMALGEVPHPVTGMVQEELEQARYLIDVLGLLQEKTQGNLNAEETSLLDGLLYELRMKFVEKTQGRPPG